MTRLSATGNDSDAGEALVTRLRAHTALLESEVEINRADHPYGFARLDAFGAILNRVASTSLAIPENAAMSNAPVSYPFLWDTPALDWVQWNGSAANPIGRNVGEVLGTYAHFTLTDTPPSQQFESTANIRNLFRLEQLVAQLTAPAWPDELFGRPDPEKVELGRQLYANRCSRCHRIRDEDGNFALTEPNQAGRRFIRTTMASVGTDEQMVTNFARLAAPGPLRPLLPPAVRDNPRVSAALPLSVAVQGVLARKLSESQPPFDKAELAALNGYRDPEIRPPNPAAYKARPHNGIWATAPFLHNGSVPNLYQLLPPENERVQSFYVGNRQFDPVQVGFQTEPFAGGFEFRTRTQDGQPIPGNSNAGHSGRNHTQVDVGDGTFRDFTDDERWALVEYLKTVN